MPTTSRRSGSCSRVRRATARTTATSSTNPTTSTIVSISTPFLGTDRHGGSHYTGSITC